MLTLAPRNDHADHSTLLTLTLVPAVTCRKACADWTAVAKTLHGDASRVSPSFEMGVGPYPIAIAGPSGQKAISPGVVPA